MCDQLMKHVLFCDIMNISFVLTNNFFRMNHLWSLYIHSKEHDNNGYLDKHITSYKYITKEINALYELYCCCDY